MRLDPASALDAEPARYVLAVDVAWPQGGITFYVGVEIVGSAGDAEASFVTPARSLEVELLTGPDPGDLPSGMALFGGADSEMWYERLDWPGDPVTTQPLFEFPEPIPPGLGLRVLGDMERAEASIDRVGPSPAEPVPLEEDVGVLPSDPGRYRLTVIGHWDRAGSSSRS